MSSPPPLPRWPAARAALLALVLLVHGVAASPLARSAKPQTFKDPIAVAEIQRWQRGLASVGVEVDEAELVDFALWLGQGSAELRRSLLKPFMPLLRLTGTGQGWGLFTYPNTHPHRMHIEIVVNGEPRLLYRALDPEHTWREGWFRYRRVRGVFDDNATRTRESYDNFVRWIARVALAEFPEAEALRVYMVRSHVVLPGEPLDPEVSRRLERTVTRAELEAGP